MQIRDLIPWSRREPVFSREAEDQHPVLALQREMNRVFDSFWSRFEPMFDGFGDMRMLSTPRTDVVDAGDAIEVSVELPGLSEKDIDVSLTDDALTIRGEKKCDREESRKGFYLAERRYGAFHRSIPLPAGIATDDVKAEFKNGVLTVRLPKTPEAKARVKKIDVKAA